MVIKFLGIEYGALKSVGKDGAEFFPPEKITTIETETIEKSKNIDVSVPEIKNEIADKIRKTKYLDSPSFAGWAYLGTYANGEWDNRSIEISDLLLPELGKSYLVIANSLSIREGYPSFPFYSLKDRIGFAVRGDLVKIEALEPDIGKSRVWAKVAVYKRSPNQ